MNAPKFKTHPNAPTVVNWFVTATGRHNANPFGCKYTTPAHAEWILGIMQKYDMRRTWYIIGGAR